MSSMARPHSLVLEDKVLLPEPLMAVALFDFDGDTALGELTFSKGAFLVSAFSLGDEMQMKV